MEQNKFVKHSIIKNYEASREGIIRHCRLKKPVGTVINTGYLMFRAGGKHYLSHRFVCECLYGIIENGLVIDYINSDPKDNSLINLQAITQSQKSARGGTGKHKIVGKRVAKSVNVATDEEIIFS